MDLDDLKEKLKEKLDASRNFFQDTHVNLVFTGRDFEENEKQDIRDFVAQQINIGKVDFCNPVEKRRRRKKGKIYLRDRRGYDKVL